MPSKVHVLDTRQAAAYLLVSPDWLTKAAGSGAIPAFRVGRQWRFKRASLDAWMDQQGSEGAKA